MKCEKCKTERKNGGEYYEFYYGTEVGKDTKDVTYRYPGTPSTMRHYETTTRYRIAGSASLFICYRCVTQFHPLLPIPLAFFASAVSLILAAVLSVAYRGPQSSDLNGLLTMTGVVCGIWGFIEIVTEKRAIKQFESAETGDQQAIKQIKKRIPGINVVEAWSSEEILSMRRDVLAQQEGDLIALKLREANLRQQGFDSFFTRQQYAELKSDLELMRREESELRDLTLRHR